MTDSDSVLEPAPSSPPLLASGAEQGTPPMTPDGRDGWADDPPTADVTVPVAAAKVSATPTRRGARRRAPKSKKASSASEEASGDTVVHLPVKGDAAKRARRSASVISTPRLRRHRENADLPSWLVPADIPDDAEGRVLFISCSPPPDVLPGVAVDELDFDAVMEVAEPLGPVASAITAMTRAPVRLLMRGGIAGWAPVGLLGVLFVVVFLIGMRLAK